MQWDAADELDILMIRQNLAKIQKAMLPSSKGAVSISDIVILDDNLTEDYSLDRVKSPMRDIAKGSPFRQMLCFLALCKSGHAVFKINLKEYELGPGGIMVCYPGMIVESIKISSDCKGAMVAFAHEVFFPDSTAPCIKTLRRYMLSPLVLQLDEKRSGMLFTSYNLLKSTLQKPDYDYKKDTIQGYFVGNIGAFERICSMMGHTNALTAPYEDPEAYQAYIDGYTEYRLEQFEFIKKYYDVDFLMMHDDWGNQNGMFMSPDMWRQFYKESERRLAARAHELGMKYMHHSCGYITPIVGDLVEIGVDSWHAVQPMNDLKMLKETYGDKLIFAGCVDAQVTDVPGVTEDVVRAEVRRVIDTLGKGGGLMVSSSVMFSIIPKVDGIIDDEGKKYGQYSTLKFA